jgi:adenylate cyclase
VNCAVEIQRDLAERNTELAYNRQMQFRIGVNLGDVIEEDGRIYGDGVNIAARVESLAEAGGICISGRAYDQVENKLGLEYEDLGKHEVKNISRPIQVYRVLSYPGAAAHRVVQAKETLGRKWRKIAITAVVTIVLVAALGIWHFYMRSPSIEPASEKKMAYPLPDKPSIAVLPFVNMSGDPEQEYIGDSISENIITALSYIPEMFVIARTSTSVYKGKAVKIKQVSEELGVRYVLEGSIQKAGDQIRVTAQLIDAVSGHHLWADRYDRDIEDFFDVLDEIAKKVAIELQVKLTEGEIARISHRTDNFEAWASATTAYSFVKLITREDMAKAKELFEKAVKLDPGYAFAWGGLGGVHLTYMAMGWSESPAKSFKMAVESTDKALKLDETLTCATAVKGRLYGMQRQFEQAIATGKRAIELGPSYDLSYGHLSYVMLNAGNFRESSTLMKKAMRLNPHYPAWYLYVLARSYFHEGRYEEAVEAGNRVLERAQKGEFSPLFVQLGLSAAYTELGKKEEASAHAAEVLRINPKFSLEYYAKFNQFKNKADFERYVAALRKAGLPDKPPLPLPDKPSIAVLAFDNLSGDPEQEYFSDGISEEIISALSKTDQLFVIARNSSFTYKGKPVKVQQIARELGVRYVLEGSVRKSEDRVRITAQLIDATTGHHLWSERYDRDLVEIFAIQDEITMKIITALQVELTEGEQMRIWAKRYKRLDVQLKAMELLSLWREGTLESYMRHGQVAQEVIDMAPELSIGYRTLGWHHWVLATFGKSPRENLKKAFELAQKAISLDNSDGFSHALLGSVYSMMKQHEKAIVAGGRSIELDPNVADINVIFGQTLNYAGRPDEGMEYIKKAIRLNPYPPYFYFSNLGESYQQRGQPEAALTEYKKALQLAPQAPHIHGALAVTYILLGREEEARASAAKCLELAPYVSVDFIKKTSRYKNKTHLDLICDAFRKAGFPEGT